MRKRFTETNRRRFTSLLPGTKSDFRLANKMRVKCGSNAGSVPLSVYIEFRLFAL